MRKRKWDDLYKFRRLDEIPWHSGQPDKYLVRLVKEKNIEKGWVLDMCSGDGTNSIYLASRGFKVIGIDISPTAVEIARARCLKRKLSCDYVVGNVLDLKLGKKFSFVLDRGCFHHISTKKKPNYARLVNGLLKKKGKFFLLCFSEKNPPYKKNLSREDIRDYFSDYFHIHFIKDSIHKEPSSGRKRYLYASFMEKKN